MINKQLLNNSLCPFFCLFYIILHSLAFCSFFQLFAIYGCRHPCYLPIYLLEYVYSAPAEPAVESYQGYAAESPAGFDMTTLIIPFIVLIGLFLLFPTYITLDDVR